ncbi:MAG: hypothetical protein EA389_14350 [Ilumatobacter sp.]|nr:MAG: hypothetical protein EA389_14350 [Ilumatobacter sp.]
MSDQPADRPPDDTELLALVEQLDADNERLRTKALDLIRLMEDAVTEQVAGERRIEELEARVETLEAEIQSLENSRVLRMTRPLRAAYGRLLSRRGGAR